MQLKYFDNLLCRWIIPQNKYLSLASLSEIWIIRCFSNAPDWCVLAHYSMPHHITMYYIILLAMHVLIFPVIFSFLLTKDCMSKIQMSWELYFNSATTFFMHTKLSLSGEMLSCYFWKISKICVIFLQKIMIIII